MLDQTCLSTIDDSVAYLAGSSLPPHKHSPVESPRRPLPPTARVRLTDPATHVVTDFTWEQPVTVTEDRPIDDTLRDMILAGVRALLQWPLTLKQFLLTSNYSRHDEIEVRHIMTLWEHVPRLDWRDICAARVTDIVEFFKSTGTTHVVLVEQTEHKGAFVRGIISRTRLVHQLGSSVYV
jgi:hypothetical protein